MMHKVRIGDRSRVDAAASAARFEQLQKRRDEVRHYAVDVQAQCHGSHNLGK